MKQYQDLIGRLAETRFVHGGGCHHSCKGDCKGGEERAYPILIGDVLLKVKEATTDSDMGELIELASLWEHCGFTKSLQEILEENVEESDLCMWCGTKYEIKGGCDCESPEFKNQLTPQAKDLFDFLITNKLYYE